MCHTNILNRHNTYSALFSDVELSIRPTALPSESSPAAQPGCPEPDRICSLCAECLPADQFRFRSRATGVRMHQCRSCHAASARARHRSKRTRVDGWLIQTTASQIARSTNVNRSLALLEQLVAAVGGPRKLLELWRAECVKLTNQRRSSTRLARMYEMLVVLAGQVRARSDDYGETEKMASVTGTTARGPNGAVLR